MKPKNPELTAQLADIRQLRCQSRRRGWRSSKLLPYAIDLIQLREEGATYRDLSLWLRKYKRRLADPTTIRRFLIKLQEDHNA